jgi:hypothetical protein
MSLIEYELGNELITCVRRLHGIVPFEFAVPAQMGYSKAYRIMVVQ